MRGPFVRYIYAPMPQIGLPGPAEVVQAEKMGHAQSAMGGVGGHRSIIWGRLREGGFMRATLMVRVFGLACGLIAASFGAKADDCDAVKSADFAQAKLPYAGTTITTIPGTPALRSEVVFTGTKMYFQIGTEWHSTPYTAQQTIDKVTDMWKQAVRTCHKAGNEAVNGEPVTVFAVHTEFQGAPSDSRVWVSNRSGLALKSEAQMQGGMTAILTYRYDNIQAPPGAH